MSPRFSLVVCASADGFIARHDRDNPALWASPEEQALFLDRVAAADWSVMGRATHQLADRPDRRRIVFSTAGGMGAWRRPQQVWVDPATQTPKGLGTLVSRVHPLSSGLILGGTRVHDWFWDHRAIDRVYLTVEPIRFGAGLPIFTDQSPGDPLSVFAQKGFRPHRSGVLNDRGTQSHLLLPDT